MQRQRGGWRPGLRPYGLDTVGKELSRGHVPENDTREGRLELRDKGTKLRWKAVSVELVAD